MTRAVLDDSVLDDVEALADLDRAGVLRDVATAGAQVREALLDLPPRVLSPAVAERAVSEMHRARLVTVAGAGHSVPGDNPDDFTAAVTEFLGDLEMGRFEPTSAAEPPPLSTRMEEEEATRGRGSFVTVALLAGVGAAALLVGTVAVRAVMARRRRPRNIPAFAPALNVDIERARRRAFEVATELNALGQSGLSRARTSLRDVDLDRARESARDLVHSLGDATVMVRDAASRIDAGKVRNTVTSKRNRQRGRAFGVLAMRVAMHVAPAIIAKRTRRRRSWATWRS